MATYTSFLNLEKPTTSERLDVLKINSNWDKIDEGVSSLNSKLTQISKITISGTLSSGGSISTGLQNKAILGVVIPHGSALYTGCVSYSSGGVPWITVYDIRTMSPIGAEAVSIDVYYCDFK